ncbi:MAG: type VI secretion system baseplate subunit TssK [Maricaulaceae bacterium]
MKPNNRVVWTEGMFLRTQHFQQADRYAEALVADALDRTDPDLWGLTGFTLNEGLLKTGKIALDAAQGALDDGTPFNCPATGRPPKPLIPPKDVRDAVVYLGAPLAAPGAVDAAWPGEAGAEARFLAVEEESPDTTTPGAAFAPITVAELNLTLFYEGQDAQGYALTPIAKIVEVRSDDTVVLDARFIPSVLRCAAAPGLLAWLSELRGLLHQRGEAVAGRLGSTSAGGVAEITDFLLLQTINRYEAWLDHLANPPHLHPRRLYELCVSLAGELATFTESGNRPRKFPGYRHRDLQAAFAPVIAALRDALSAVFEQNAVAIPLEARRYGIRVAKVEDRSLFRDASFVLAAKAGVDGEVLRTNLPKRITLGAVERIRDLVNMQLGGAPIRPLATEPRQIPYRAGVVYFEISAEHEEWEMVKASGGVAVHVAGDFPNLELALWAIRGR